MSDRDLEAALAETLDGMEELGFDVPDHYRLISEPDLRRSSRDLEELLQANPDPACRAT